VPGYPRFPATLIQNVEGHVPRKKKKDFEYTIEELVKISKKYPEFDSPSFQLYVQDFTCNTNVELMSPEAVSGYL